MIVRKVISPRIPLIYIGTVAVFVFIFGGFDVNYTINQIFAGGLIFGAFFMATDYVTSPITKKGQVVFGILLGLLTESSVCGRLTGGRFLRHHSEQPLHADD